MTCFHPIKAFIVGETDNGKKLHKFVNKNEQLIEQITLNGKIYTEYDLLPCGRCIGCLVERSRQWATRMMLELMYHERACFITLTYDDEHLNVREYVNQDGELCKSFTLWKPDFQKFMKRLRRHYEPKEIRFFACGEYGGKTGRPHYHAILFGIDFSEDRYIWRASKDGYYSYRSPTLEKIWPFGISQIDDVTWNSCAYVSRYCTKKKYGRQNIYYQTFNIEPEFNLMSRRPGIGHQYFVDHGDEVYINQEIFLRNNKGAMKVRPPAYFDRLYDIEYPDEMEAIRKARKEMAENAMALKLERTNYNLFELLQAEERAFKDRIATLRREKV